MVFVISVLPVTPRIQQSTPLFVVVFVIFVIPVVFVKSTELQKHRFWQNLGLEIPDKWPPTARFCDPMWCATPYSATRATAASWAKRALSGRFLLFPRGCEVQRSWCRSVPKRSRSGPGKAPSSPENARFSRKDVPRFSPKIWGLSPCL